MQAARVRFIQAVDRIDDGAARVIEHLFAIRPKVVAFQAVDCRRRLGDHHETLFGRGQFDEHVGDRTK